MRGMVSRFCRDDKGAVTIEFTVLVPFFIMLLVFFVDAAVVWLTHSEMFNVARDMSRRMATGEITSNDELADYAASHMFLGGDRTYTILSDFGDENRVLVRVPVGEAAIFGAWFRPVLGKRLEATAMTRSEPRLERE